MNRIAKIGFSGLVIVALAWAGLHCRTTIGAESPSNAAPAKQRARSSDGSAAESSRRPPASKAQRQEATLKENAALSQARQEYLAAKAAVEADYDRYARELQYAQDVGPTIAAGIGKVPLVRARDPYLIQQYEQALRRYQQLGGVQPTFELPAR